MHIGIIGNKVESKNEGQSEVLSVDMQSKPIIPLVYAYPTIHMSDERT